MATMGPSSGAAEKPKFHERKIKAISTRGIGQHPNDVSKVNNS